VQHIVICWLKTPGDRAAAERLANASRKFAEIPGVLDVRAGQVLKSDREIVDSSFDVAVILTFESHFALADYLNHPAHKKAVKDTLRPLTAKIVVYDFVE
jgi:heme-degrading monooxygenase HmoA